MSSSALYRPLAEVPAEASLRSHPRTGVWEDLSTFQFEFVSRGDFVPGILALPGPTENSQISSTSARPLVLVQHGLGGSCRAEYLDFAARWVREGWAVAGIDLPLHGERQSPKLSARLIDGIDRLARNEDLDLDTFALVEEFARQSTSDLTRALDALTAHPEIDPTRIGFLGLSLGAIVGSYFLAHDARPRAAVLALAGGGAGPAELDPATYLQQRSKSSTLPPCPILVVAAEDDTRISLDASRRLFDAAPEPKEFVSVPGEHGQLPGAALGQIQSFLGKGIGV